MSVRLASSGVVSDSAGVGVGDGAAGDVAAAAALDRASGLTSFWQLVAASNTVDNAAIAAMRDTDS